MLGMLLPLGIEKGKDFKPDGATVTQLNAAAADAWLVAQLPKFVENWWPSSQWKVPILAIGPQTGFKWTVANYFDVDSRGIAFSSFFLPPAKLGSGSFYLGANFDDSGQPLRGENTYRLHVSANVPVASSGQLPFTTLKRQPSSSTCHARRLIHLTKYCGETPTLGGYLLRPEGTRRSGAELDLHSGAEELVPVVSILWPGEAALR